MSAIHPLADVHLHHGALSVSNIAQSVAFYKAALGFEVSTHAVVGDGQLEIVHLAKGDSFLELFCHRNATSLPDHARDNESDFPVIGTKHVAFGTDHPEALHAWLSERGVAGLTEIREGPDYRYFFFKDPDGIILEVVSRKGRPTRSP